MPATLVEITRLAELQVKALRGAVAAAYVEFLRDLAARGCEALHYRLTGNVVERICSRHLRDRYRALVCFPAEGRAVILLVGEHDGRDPSRNMYALLYRMLDLPTPEGERTKPACCSDDGDPPVDAELLDQFEAKIKELRRLRDASLARSAEKRPRRRPS